MRYAVVGLILGCASGAHAGQFALPRGCEAYLTVQYDNCSLSHHFTCAVDPDGHQWAVFTDRNGRGNASRIDRETRWVQSFSLPAATARRTVSETDPFSLSELLETGEDQFDFMTRSADGEELRWTGVDRLEKETEVIDGVEFGVISFQNRVANGEGEVQRMEAGTNFISREWRMYLPRTHQVWDPEGTVIHEEERRPVDIVFPEDDGFLALEPIHGCAIDVAFDAE
ncbi:hypothetical protein AAD018_001625 [Aestuariibius insulae]|uniref:hypothetical protein n=1 Tax=Aestuariibius insulae TaxID=2058287 RepID=UPI00345EDD25